MSRAASAATASSCAASRPAPFYPRPFPSCPARPRGQCAPTTRTPPVPDLRPAPRGASTGASGSFAAGPSGRSVTGTSIGSGGQAAERPLTRASVWGNPIHLCASRGVRRFVPAGDERGRAFRQMAFDEQGRQDRLATEPGAHAVGEEGESPHPCHRPARRDRSARHERRRFESTRRTSSKP